MPLCPSKDAVAPDRQSTARNVACPGQKDAQLSRSARYRMSNEYMLEKTPWEKDLTFLKMKKLKTKYFPLAYKIPYCKKLSILFYSDKLGLVVTQGHKQLFIDLVKEHIDFKSSSKKTQNKPKTPVFLSYFSIAMPGCHDQGNLCKK